jgi:hypothetical protein
MTVKEGAMENLLLESKRKRVNTLCLGWSTRCAGKCAVRNPSQKVVCVCVCVVERGKWINSHLTIYTKYMTSVMNESINQSMYFHSWLILSGELGKHFDHPYSYHLMMDEHYDRHVNHHGHRGNHHANHGHESQYH